MIKTCKCGREFLTEADPYVVIPFGRGTILNCGCFFKENKKEVKQFVEVKRLLKVAHIQFSEMIKLKKGLDISFGSDWLELWVRDYKKL